MYDRVSRRHLLNQNPNEILTKNYFYRHKTAPKGEQFFLENLFSGGESKWAIMIKRIVGQGHVPGEFLGDLIEFLAVQHTRTLRARDDIRAMSDYFTTGMGILELRQALAEGKLDEKEREAVENFVADANSGELRLVDAEDNIRAQQFDMLAELAAEFSSNWNYIVVSVRRPIFVLTDHPTTVIGDWPGGISTNIGVANAEELWMPLDPQHALVLSRDHSLPPHILSLSTAHARKVNRRLVLESSRWTIYRPGTNPLKGWKIPKKPPEIFADELVMFDPVSGKPREVIQHGKQRVNIEGEQLLSGRPVIPVPQRQHNTIRGKTWLPDSDLVSPAHNLRRLPTDVAKRWQPIARATTDEAPSEV